MEQPNDTSIEQFTGMAKSSVEWLEKHPEEAQREYEDMMTCSLYRAAAYIRRKYLDWKYLGETSNR